MNSTKISKTQNFEEVIAYDSSFRILIVDDDSINFKVLSNYLSIENYSVIRAKSGQDALDICQKYGKPDLVILDLMMPEMSCFEVCQKLRKNYSSNELPIILLTAKNLVADLVKGFSIGSIDFLTKPISKNELLVRIYHHLQISKTFEEHKMLTEKLNHEVSKRKKIEKELWESEERFRLHYNSSFGGVVIHEKGIILECNMGISLITGYEYNELIGTHVKNYFTDDTRNQVIGKINSDCRNSYEAKGVRKNGDIYFLRLESKNINYKGKKARVVEIKDVTESMREKESLEAQLCQAQKMVAIAGTVAHDLSNMLSLIIGFSDLCLMNVHPSQPIYAKLKEWLNKYKHFETFEKIN